MITAINFKTGILFENDKGEIWEVITYLHHRKSQARAVVRVKMRNIENGAVTETSFRPEDKFNSVNVEKKPCTYLYTDKDGAHFMNSENYEQFAVPVEKIKDKHKFLTENMDVEGLYLNGKFSTVNIPIKMKMKIASTVPGVRGDTVSNLTKLASLENGQEIKVPLFINEGDEVIIDTRTGEYVERA